MSCIFCEIIEQNVPALTVYEDDLVKVIMNIKPKVNGHLLIIPKNHVVDLTDIPLELLNHINAISKKMYILMLERLNIDGVTVLNNSGSSQEVKHFHMHIIPNPKNNEELFDIETIYNKLK